MSTAEGRRGEEAAFRFLRRRKFQVLERNYRGPRYEVDIIARESEVLAFVEVKTRARGREAEGAAAVGVGKRRRIARAAEHYLMTHPEERDAVCRFDVVLVETAEDGKPRVKHIIRDAFRL